MHMKVPGVKTNFLPRHVISVSCTTPEQFCILLSGLIYRYRANAITIALVSFSVG